MKIPPLNLLVSLAALMLLAGCASIGPPQAPSLELPKPPADLHAARKGDKVTLTWTIPARTTERQSIRYLGKTRVCRSFAGAMKQCDGSPGEVPPPENFEQVRKSGKRLTATFIDTLPFTEERAHPSGFATYAIDVLNEAGRGAGISNQVRVPLVPTLPPFRGFGAQVTAKGVLISWQCAAPRDSVRGVEYLFRIYRRAVESTGAPEKIADVPATSCAEGTKGLSAGQSNGSLQMEKGGGSFLNQNFEWEQTYFYCGTIVSVIDAAGKPRIEVEGEDTPDAKAFAHDVFPPAVPQGLQAVSSGPGQQPFIDLVWTPVTDSDLAGYNVYRYESGAAATKINTELVSAPAYRDMNVAPGKSYVYSVSAVDERGNESQKSNETSETIEQQ
jgi:hypothetical protein